jgi:hypothetical protein
MHEKAGNRQFGLSSILLWTAALAMMLGVLKTLHVGGSLAGYIYYWVLAVSVARVAVSPKTAVLVSIAIGTIVAAAFVCLPFSATWIGGGVLAVLVGFPIGLSSGLIVAVIVEFAVRGVGWADEFIQSL